MQRSDIKITLTTTPKEKPAKGAPLGFGRIFTDHMFLMNYDEGQGWHDPRIVPYAPIPLDPASMCLHYGQEVFEGLKAYRTPDGQIQLFRPDRNMRRLNSSNERMCIPLIDEEFAVEAIKTLVDLERDWIPTDQDTSLYIRPFIFAVDPFVGVHPAKHLIFAIILSPVGAYFASGLKPVNIYVESSYVRAVRGGTGYVKTAANYAISLKAQQEAETEGYSQVLWLDGVERKYVEEVGAMNVFFVFDGEIVTPSLDGATLPGITRMSVIELLRSWGYNVSERKLPIEEIAEKSEKGQLLEAFGSGTAAVISPIGQLKWNDQIITMGNGEIGSLTAKLYDQLTGIQWGRLPDPFGWTVRI